MSCVPLTLCIVGRRDIYNNNNNMKMSNLVQQGGEITHQH